MVLVAMLLALRASAGGEDISFAREVFFNGACDASAGAALTDDLFAAADDESNRVRVYSLSRGGAPVAELSLGGFLRVELKQPEADIEGAARVGDVIYWIGSHARNQSGKVRSSRQRFFATKIVSIDPPKLQPLGQPYDDLLSDLEQAPQLQAFELEEASELAPKKKSGLNIEGLCAGPNGSLLIGFRNPVPKKHALLVPLLNPAEILERPGTKARLGEPIQLDLDGRGIRDIVQRQDAYYIVAGAYNSADRFELYRWDGRENLSLLHKWPKKSLNPEAILALPGKQELLILTDEGSKKVDNRECKDLPPPNRRFRGVLIEAEVP